MSAVLVFWIRDSFLYLVSLFERLSSITFIPLSYVLLRVPGLASACPSKATRDRYTHAWAYPCLPLRGHACYT